MHPVRIAAAILTAAIPILALASPSSSAAPPGELITVPAVQQWTPDAAGVFEWAGGELVVEAGNAELEEVAETFAEDIHEITGSKPDVAVGGTASEGSIVLALGDQGQGDESYGLDIADSLTITGTTPHGAFNGTRSVLQLLRQGDIPHGTVLDWPEYEVRSVLFDQTPRHVSMGWWENFFKQMSYVKLNDTNLYLDGVGLDKAEMRAIDELGAKYYVKVVPQINMPSHMHVWLAAHPEYQLVNQDGSLNQTAIDLTNEEAVDWALGLIEEHVGLFQGDEWHLGSDEYPGWPGTGANHPQLDAYAKEKFGPDATFADLFADFQNRANALIKESGKHMRVWNDMVRTSSVVQLDADVSVEYWIQHDGLPGLLSAAQIAERGNPMINAHIDHLYYDQSRRNLDPRDVYEKLEVDVFHWETPVPHASVRGARMPAWLAWINTSMESDAEVLNNLVPSMHALAQKTWGSDKLVETWTEFTDVIATVGEAPGLRAESLNSIQPDPATARNADETVAYFARDAEGRLWTGKQSRPGVAHFSQHQIGEGVAGDPVVTTLDDGRLQVVARTSSDTLLVATQAAPNSEEFDSRVLDVPVTADPALVPGRAVVNSDGTLAVVNLTDGAVSVIGQGAVGVPDATYVDSVLHVVSRHTGGTILASEADGTWNVTEDATQLSSDPEVLSVENEAMVIGTTTAGTLSSAERVADSLEWSAVLEDAVGQQFSDVSPEGVAHVVVRTGSATLMHASHVDGAWRTGRVAERIVQDPTLGFNPAGEPFMFSKFDNGMQMVGVPVDDGYATNVLAESTVGRAAVTHDSHGWPIYFVATSYGDLQTGSKWGNLWQWGRDFAIGTMSYPDDDLTPDQFDKVLLRDTFDSDTSDEYTVLKTSASEIAPAPVVGGGTLAVSADEPYYSTLVPDIPVTSTGSELAPEVPGDTVVITEVDQWLNGDGPQDTIMVGFVRDAENYSMMWVSHEANRIGFDTVSNGVLQPNSGNGNVPVVVESGDRIAVVLSGNFMTGCIERNGVWHRVHTAPANGLDNLRDPEVRAQYRYAVGLRGTKGTLRIGEFTAAQRSADVVSPSPEPSPTPTATSSPSPTPTTTASPSPTPTTSASPQPTPSATTKPTASTPSPSRPQQAVAAPYGVPGFHIINGRYWYTSCEPYSQTIRCRTNIWSTQVRYEGGRFVKDTGWHFNNLTYLPMMTRAQWGDNPLANSGAFTSSGRQWRTECDTAATGRGACRSHIRSDQVVATKKPDGTWSYKLSREWVFNNMVIFRR